MKKYKKLLLTLAFFILNIQIAYAEVKIEASIDRGEIRETEQANITVKIIGGNPTEPDIEYTNDYDIQRSGTSISTEIINGVMSSGVAFNYTITPKKVGKIIIKPITTQVDGKVYSTSPIELKVVKDEDKKITENKSNFFIVAEVDNKNPYLNEQVVYTLKFYRNVKIGNNSVKMPEFKDFWVEDDNKDGRATEYEKIINNELYQITEVKKYLYPSKTGKIVIPKTVLDVEIIYKRNVDNFFGIFSSTKSEVERLQTQEIILNVKNIPNNKPSNFSNVVGKNLKLETKISQNTGNIGEPINLRYTLSGKGNIFDFSGIKLNESPYYKLYNNKPKSYFSKVNNERINQKDINFSVIPAQKGKITIPSKKIAYFDTEAKQFKDLTTKDVNLNITGEEEKIFEYGTSKGNLPTNSEKIDIKNTLSIENELNTSKKIFYSILFFIPPTFYFILGNKKIISNLAIKKKQNHLIFNKLDEINNKYNGIESLDKLKEALGLYLKQEFNINIDDIKDSKYIEIANLIEKIHDYKYSGKNISQEEKKAIFNDLKIILTKFI